MKHAAKKEADLREEATFPSNNFGCNSRKEVAFHRALFQKEGNK